MNPYPSIESLYTRDRETHKLNCGDVRNFAWSAVTYWQVTEKVDGTNVRVIVTPDGNITYMGRRSDQLPKGMKDVLDGLFLDKVGEIVKHIPTGATHLTFYGEGYGVGIKGSEAQKYVTEGKHFIAFDAYVQSEVGGYYLNGYELRLICDALGVMVAPLLRPLNLEKLIYPDWNEVRDVIAPYRNSVVSPTAPSEGIVCRPSVELRDSFGNRMIWKLAFRDVPS